MKELTEYRLNLLKRLEETADEFCAECRRVADPHARLSPDGWTVHQIAVHTRDVDKLVYGLRARRTAVEDNPEFPNFNGEAYMTANYDPGEPMQQVLQDLAGNVRALTGWLQTLPPESWSRVSRHTTLGRDLTLQSWVEKDLAHIQEHLEGVKHYRSMKDLH